MILVIVKLMWIKRILHCLRMSIFGVPLPHLFPQWKYREQYEKAKDKFTSILETPEHESHKRSKKISDVSLLGFVSVHSSRQSENTHFNADLSRFVPLSRLHGVCL